MSEEELQTLDGHILRCEILSGLAAIRDCLKCTLTESNAAYAARYDELRKLKPGAFSLPHDQYWDGFYS